MAHHRSFEDLAFWKAGRIFRIKISELTKKLPSDERYRLVDQLIRASSTSGIKHLMLKVAEIFVLIKSPVLIHSPPDIYRDEWSSTTQRSAKKSRLGMFKYLVPEVLSQ